MGWRGLRPERGECLPRWIGRCRARDLVSVAFREKRPNWMLRYEVLCSTSGAYGGPGAPDGLIMFIFLVTSAWSAAGMAGRSEAGTSYLATSPMCEVCGDLPGRLFDFDLRSWDIDGGEERRRY